MQVQSLLPLSLTYPDAGGTREQLLPQSSCRLWLRGEVDSTGDSGGGSAQVSPSTSCSLPTSPLQLSAGTGRGKTVPLQLTLAKPTSPHSCSPQPLAGARQEQLCFSYAPRS